MHVAQATKNDALIVGRFVYSLMVEMQHQSPNMNEAFYAAKCEELLESSVPNYVFVAKDASDKPVGLITLGISSAIYAEGLFGIINELYVVPELRSQGIGKLLLDEAKRFAASKGCTRLEVTIAPMQINPRTIGFYLREKFVEVGSRLKFQIPTEYVTWLLRNGPAKWPDWLQRCEDLDLNFTLSN